MMPSAQRRSGTACRAYPSQYRLRLFCLLISLTSSASLAFAQTRPPEAVYVHWDRDVYAAGTTAWFKAYVVSDHAFSSLSTVLHVRLSAPSGAPVVHSTLPLVGGTAYGQIALPDTLRTGFYLIQAFTPGMLGLQNVTVYERRFLIAGMGPLIPTTRSPAPSVLQVRLFPESGRLLTGVPNRVAFHGRVSDGMGRDFRGRIVDDTGLEVAEVASFRDGRGSFVLNPQKGRAYNLEVDSEDKAYSFPLPSHESDVVAFGVEAHPEGFVFTLHDRTPAVERRAASVIGEMQGRTVFRVEVPADRRDVRAVIRTDSETIRSGILTFRVLNTDGMPLAERKVFVDQPGSEVEADIVWDTLDYSPRSTNRFTLKSAKPLDGAFSLSVHDGAPDPLGGYPSSMKADLLLKPSLPGWFGEDAGWYFTAGKDSATKGLDLLLLTEGWSRIDWNRKAAKENSQSANPDPGFIEVSGVLDEPVKSSPRRIMMLMEGPAFGRRTEFADVDARGRFRIDSLLFFGDANLSFFDPSVKKGKPLKVTLSSTPVGATMSSSKVPSRFSMAGAVNGDSDASTLPLERPPGRYDSSVAMKEIVVSARAKTPAQRLNEKYAKGFFEDGEERLLDLTDPGEQPVQLNIFEYLKFRVPGIQVMDPNYEVASMPGLGDDPFNDPQGYRVFYRQQPSVSSLGNIPMAVYLNEVQTSTNVVATIPANQFVMVKVFSTFAPAPGGGAGGALALYTRDPSFVADGRSVAPVRYKGFDIVREFPDADPRLSAAASKGTDDRRTFLWRPNLRLESGSATFRFLSNDRPSRYRISLRGMTSDGRMLSVDRTVQK